MTSLDTARLEQAETAQTDIGIQPRQLQKHSSDPQRTASPDTDRRSSPDPMATTDRYQLARPAYR